MKRTLTFGCATAIVLATLAGANAQNAAAPSQLVIYSAEEVVQDFAKLYMQKNPTVTVKVLAGSSGEANARVAAEKDNPKGDITVSGTDPSQANPTLYRKATGSLDLTNVDPRFISGDYAVPMMIFPLIYAYNVKQLGADKPPTTWAELADPKWKGRLYMGNPATSEAAYKALSTFWAIGGWDLVEKVAANAIVTEGSQDPLRALGNSEAAIGIGVENQVYKWADNKAVVAVYPADGMIMHIGTWYIVNNSPNPKGAVDFMQWMLSPETQTHMVKTYQGMRPSITKASETNTVPKVSDLKIIAFPEEAQRERRAFNERWKKIITSVK